MKITEIELNSDDLEEALKQLVYNKYQLNPKKIIIQEFDPDNLSCITIKLIYKTTGG